MAKNIHEIRREELKGSVLCSEHAKYYNLTSKDVVIENTSGNLDEPIACECCSLMAMKQAGVL